MINSEQMKMQFVWYLRCRLTRKKTKKKNVGPQPTGNASQVNHMTQYSRPDGATQNRSLSFLPCMNSQNSSNFVSQDHPLDALKQISIVKAKEQM